jgi:sporulation protein YtfJ
MSDNTKLEQLVKTALEKIKELSECETVVGKPVTTPDGTTIIPVSKVSMGFASGGSDLPTKSGGQFGGGSGAGVTVQPIAFIVCREGETKLLQITTNTAYQNAIVNTVPEVVDKVIGVIEKKTGKKLKKDDNEEED